ncbi:multiple organellar RNA editing factor 1, mitochondrial isoform X2 [Juglans microcarpa x Juglans regia]|uniref:multiple organellar RNA editing factor 1, mitochondrial isoform X2 n=1 Tax=Juglans microcarpa x Juglans regia TaxID=2249226 RepID=UPI001B7E3ADF|nr:multiple organellar RNA editing factor 1, mitochondrial isoform X2 [Juglans microcarpa x Juglans regia]
MALYSFRLRRTLTSLSTLNRSLYEVSSIPAISTPASQSPLLQGSTFRSSRPFTLLFQSRPFKSTTFVPSSARSTYNSNSTEEIGPDTILFEGCDYNHWLIVMDFPKDPKPTPEQMVQTYEETCAKGLNISLEEAKKKMYACSTTTYSGFQAVMTEEESNKFHGLPGVIFVLPDSYIDPINKEYGGDKYINGTIIPRPPPVQYGRPGRNRDRRYGQGPTSNQQWKPSNDYQMSGDGRNYGAPQNHPPQQNYAPPRQGERGDHIPMNNRNYAPGGTGNYQSGRGDPVPSYQSNYNPGGRGNYSPQEQRDFPQRDQSHYGPPGQGNFAGANRNYGPSQDGSYGRGPGGYQGQETYGPSGQGASSGNGQGYPGHGQGYPGHGEAQRFSQEEQRNWQGEPRTYAPRGPTGNDQGRY